VNLIPGISGVDFTNQRISASNPGIKPERSRTFNASLEYYFEPVGVVSFSVFDTEIEDRQFFNFSRLGSSGYAGDTQFANWELAGVVNVTSPTGYRGFELDYSQQLSFLPGAAKGFGVFANHTRVIFDDRAFNLGSPEHMTNGGVSYKFKRFSGRVNLNHVGKLLQNAARNYSAATNSWTNAGPFVQVYQKDRLVTDINLEYQITDSLTLFVDGRNILNEESVYTYFEREHNFERILKTGGIWMAGIKGTF
jgi:outer membrane receptor protein involved in Fe transport